MFCWGGRLGGGVSVWVCGCFVGGEVGGGVSVWVCVWFVGGEGRWGCECEYE